MTERTSHLAGLWIGAAISNTSHSNKTDILLSNEHGSQVKDQGRRQCCHNRHKNILYRSTCDVSLLSGHASYYTFHRISVPIFSSFYPSFLLLRTGEIHFARLLNSRNVPIRKNGGKLWKVTELGNSNNQINLGWFVMGNASYRCYFQNNVCGNTGGQFSFVLIIREVNKGKYLDDILFSRTGLSLSYLNIFKPT